MSIGNRALALFGGDPVVSDREWPQWPQSFPETELFMREALDSGVWAITGRSSGTELQSSRLRQEFAEFTTRSWCVEVDHGTSALVAAFEALEIGRGDEIIVPVLTWVACGSAVLRVGATPVFVDVDPSTLCMDVNAVRSAVTSRTAAVLVVHSNCSAVDIEGIMTIAHQHDLRVVEDCAQAHGAEWASGQLVGTHGDLAVYSFQNSKSLTGGEGGAVVGDDERFLRRVESARVDTRVSVSGIVPAGNMQVTETGELMGANYCLSEFGAAAIRGGLRHLRRQLVHKHENAAVLDDLLARQGFRTIASHPKLALRSIYEYGVFLPDGADFEMARSALTAELGTPVYEMDAPIHRSPLYIPATKRGLATPEHLDALKERHPVAEHAHASLAMIHHSVLLSNSDRMEDIARAFSKTRELLIDA